MLRCSLNLSPLASISGIVTSMFFNFKIEFLLFPDFYHGASHDTNKVLFPAQVNLQEIALLDLHYTIFLGLCHILWVFFLHHTFLYNNTHKWLLTVLFLLV